MFPFLLVRLQTRAHTKRARAWESAFPFLLVRLQTGGLLIGVGAKPALFPFLLVRLQTSFSLSLALFLSPVSIPFS